MAALRICADFNGLVHGPKTPGSTAVVLDTFGSLRDLANAGVVLHSGLPLIAFDQSDETEDLEGHGTAEFDYENSWWVVEFDSSGISDVAAGDRTSVVEFKCVSCKARLDDQINERGLKLGDVCYACGVPIHSPIAPPVS